MVNQVRASVDPGLANEVSEELAGVGIGGGSGIGRLMCHQAATTPVASEAIAASHPNSPTQKVLPAKTTRLASPATTKPVATRAFHAP
jgi:hypothetical protein